MNEFRTQRNNALAEHMIKKLAARNMNGYYAQTAEEAVKIALSIIPEGSSIARGGSKSIEECGLSDALTAGDYVYWNREVMEDKRHAMLLAYDADFYIGSTNAITEDGVLVNIDGNANRISAFAYGPRKVVLIVGMNKVAADLDSAMKRARNEAAPINAQRFGLHTPCTRTGRCMDCTGTDTICCQFLITRFSKDPDRLHIILVNEELGY